MKTNRDLLPRLLLFLSFSFVILIAGFKTATRKSFNSGDSVPVYSSIPYNTPLDAVKWTGGFWYDRMEKLRNIYIPGVLDGSYMNTENGSTYHNFLRAAGMETGSAIGSTWSDGDCFFLLDAVSRAYAYKPDTYLKSKLDYWISVFNSVQRPDGLLDSWTVLGKDGSNFQYNFGHLYKSAITHNHATSENTFLSNADKYCSYYANSSIGATHQVVYAYGLQYLRTGETMYLDKLKSYYSASRTGSGLGPPIRAAQEIYGHNTMVFHELNGAILLCELTGETALLDALNRLMQDMLAKKTYITGAVAGLNVGQRPVIIINNITYPGTELTEAFRQAFDLPLDKAYCESCGQCLHMELLYKMFRLTGNSVYMDAAERMLYNTTLGTVSLDQADFFYANPQRQGADSWRRPASGPKEHWTQALYSWDREYLCFSACCRPKVLRAIALTAEIAYNVNDEGLWVNLYGNNTLRIKLPSGDSLSCAQTTEYPWDGKIKLELSKTDSEDPFGISLRIPEWVETRVTIKINGQAQAETASPGTYHRLLRKWNAGDRIELEFPMPVRIMAADERVVENRGKAAIMRGPIVYCLENQDIPSGHDIELFYLSGDVKFSPVPTTELGGITKLTGSMVYTPQYKVFEPFNTGQDIIPEKGLYQKIILPENVVLDGGDKTVQVSLIPFYARLNRTGKFFKTWIPVYNNKQGIGVNDLESPENIILYPNPVSDRLFVSLKIPDEILTFRIYSPNGQLVKVVENMNHSEGIHIGNLGPCKYLTESRLRNQKVIMKSFVKI